MENYVVRTENDWAESTVELLRRWERDCQFRKKAHYKAANSFGWKNKLFSIPVIIISTVIGSLSFIHPSFTGSETPNDCTPARMLQSVAPTSSPTTECIWENYNTDDIITEAPFCDNSIIEYQNTFYKSTITEVDELVCDRDVNFVASTIYYQIPVSLDITTQSDAEAWCVEHDEGYGIFYQKWVDGQITYINNCGGEGQTVIDIYNGNCALIEACTSACPGIVGGYDLQTIGFYDCNCCYEYWGGCSWGECSGLVGSSPPPPTPTPTIPATKSPTVPETGSPTFIPTHAPTKLPSHAPTKLPSYAPTKLPSYAPTKLPSYAPTKLPSYAPTKPPTHAPTKLPTPAPTYKPTPAPTYKPTPAPTYKPTDAETGEGEGANFASYIIGAFNMVIAILSALHAFLKYDALEDRHHQYSRHFGNLKLDIETLLCKPISHRGDSTATMENFKTKYSVLMNNAPDLPSRLEQNCMDISCRGTIEQGGIELT